LLTVAEDCMQEDCNWKLYRFFVFWIFFFSFKELETWGRPKSQSVVWNPCADLVVEINNYICQYFFFPVAHHLWHSISIPQNKHSLFTWTISLQSHSCSYCVFTSAIIYWIGKGFWSQLHHCEIQFHTWHVSTDISWISLDFHGCNWDQNLISSLTRFFKALLHLLLKYLPVVAILAGKRCR